MTELKEKPKHNAKKKIGLTLKTGWTSSNPAERERKTMSESVDKSIVKYEEKP